MNETDYEVVVVGGGTSGVIAAIAAARMGAKTLLIERYGFLGGVAVYGMPFLAFLDGNGDRVVNGIPQELVENMMKAEGSLGHVGGAVWGNTPELSSYKFAVTPYDSETYKYVAMKMLMESGAQVLLHTTFTGIEQEEAEITAIQVQNKDGNRRITAKVFVDATGDGDLFTAAGCEYRKGNSQGKMQNVTMLFNMGGIDIEKMVDAFRNNQSISGWGVWHTRMIQGTKLDGSKGYVHIAGHMHPWNDNRYLTFTAVSIRKGEINFNITKTINIDGSDAAQMIESEQAQRNMVFEVASGLKKNVPGFESAHLISTSPQVGIRESRNIIGEYVMTSEDVTLCREFKDNIARGCYPVDIHDPEGGRTKFLFLKDHGSYGIPYRSLLPRNSKNLIVTGRCISTDHEAHGSVRIMAQAMALGQAAGTAAALAAKEGIEPGALDVAELRTLLRQNSAILDKADVIKG